MENQTFHFGVILEPPQVTNCSFLPICNKRGFSVEIAFYICQALSLNCTFKWYPTHDYGHFDTKSGHFTGLIGDVENYYYNSTLPLLTPNVDRMRVVDFTSAFLHDTVVAFTRMPNEKNLIFDWAIINSFHWKIWTCFLISFIVLVILIILITRLKIDKTDRIPSFTELAFLSFCTLLFTHDKKKEVEAISLRILICIWALVACTLSATYTGVLFSQKLIKTRSRPFVDMDSLVDCVRKKQCRMVTPTVSYATLQWALQFRTSTGLRLQDVIVDNPIQISPMDEIGQKILNSKDVYDIFVQRRGIFNEVTKNNKDCAFYFVTLPFFSGLSFPLHKNLFHLHNAFEWVTRQFIQFGMNRYLEKKYNLDLDLCQSLHNSHVEKEVTKISILSTLLAALIIYIASLLLAILLFFGEIVIFYWSRTIYQINL